MNCKIYCIFRGRICFIRFVNFSLYLKNTTIFHGGKLHEKNSKRLLHRRQLRALRNLLFITFYNT